MGTGLTTILWYGLCVGFVALTILVGVGLFIYGSRKESRRNRDRPPS
ncbi:MAG: hypothetical protein PVH21_10575 [Myxococcales bacterium]|jgi:D-alanyl-lipoteichoic acid acyltransferase DltB (MBOAT superfamily)